MYPKRIILNNNYLFKKPLITVLTEQCCHSTWYRVMGEPQPTGQVWGTTARPQITHSREISVICVLWQKLVVLNFYVSIMQIYCTYPCLNRTIARNAKRIQPEAVELDQFLFTF